MTTVFVAAEKLMNWDSDGGLLVDKAAASILASHSENNRFIVYFAPSRFGMCFESRQETQEAWDYFAASLKMAGFTPNEELLFEDEIKTSPFVDILASLEEGERAILYSNDELDAELSDSLGIRIVEAIPANISSIWQRINPRHAFRALFAAIQA